MNHYYILVPLLFIIYSLFSKPKQYFRVSQHNLEQIKSQQINLKSQNNTKDDDIRKLTRQCARWLIAAQQDDSPLIATLHLQYGMGYLWAIKDITTTDEFKRATGLDFLKFESHATQIQDQISKKMIKACPQFAGDIDRYLGNIAGEI